METGQDKGRAIGPELCPELWPNTLSKLCIRSQDKLQKIVYQSQVTSNNRNIYDNRNIILEHNNELENLKKLKLNASILKNIQSVVSKIPQLVFVNTSNVESKTKILDSSANYSVLCTLAHKDIDSKLELSYT